MAGTDPGIDDDVVYGLLRLAGMDVALPLSALREVVPCPPDLAALPVTAPGLLGAMNLRTLILPVVDLGPAAGRPTDRFPDQVVVVVAHAGQVLGLLADEVRGITQVSPSALLAMTTDGEELLFSHTFRHPVAGTVVSVLDASAVLRSPGVPTVADVADGDTLVGGVTGGTARQHGRGRKLTLLRCGPHRFAVDVEQVHTTLPSPRTRPSVVGSALCRGVTDFADREVPVVDPLALLGLGRLADQNVGAGLVLDLGHGYVVLALTSLLDLVELAAEDVLALPAFSVHRPELLAGMADIPGVGQCLVLDGAALLAEPDLLSLASVNTALDGPEASSPGRAEGDGGTTAAAVGTGEPYLTYSAGVDLATPLEQVVEILPFPGTLTSTEVGGGMIGLVVHRRAAVPVLCLATLLGRPGGVETAASCLLLVADGGNQVAFAVDALQGINPLTWTDPEQPVSPTSDDPSRVLQSSRLVQVGGQSRLLPDLDLQSLARAVASPGTAEGPQPASPEPDAVPALA